jgi:hypothetical protein
VPSTWCRSFSRYDPIDGQLDPIARAAERSVERLVPIGVQVVATAHPLRAMEERSAEWTSRWSGSSARRAPAAGRPDRSFLHVEPIARAPDPIDDLVEPIDHLPEAIAEQVVGIADGADPMAPAAETVVVAV